MPRLWATVCLVALLAGTEATARAGQVIGILSVRAEGVPDVAARTFETVIEEALEDQGFTVAPRERITRLLVDSPHVQGCVFGPCTAPIYRITEVEIVLVARVVAVESSYSIVLSLVDTRTGRPTSQVAEECAVCTLDEAISSVTLATIALVTGTGSAAVPSATGDPTELPDLKTAIRRHERARSDARHGLRRAALFFASAAVIAGGAAGVFFATDRDRLAWGASGVGGAFAVTGATMLVLSRRF